MQHSVSSSIDWKLFRERVFAAKRILLTSHIRPDGDSIGSELAMYHALTRLGKEVRIVNGHPTPPNLRFLDPEERIRVLDRLEPGEKDWLGTIDLFFVLDTSSWAQLDGIGELLKSSAAEKIVLDHHAIGNDLGAEMFVDSTAEATGALCFEAVRALNVPLDQEIAEPVFVALATDTGWFRFPSVRVGTYEIAAELVAAGARPDQLYRHLHEQESFARIRLIGRTLARAEQHLNGVLFASWIALEDFDQLGAIASDSEDIVNMLLQVGGSKLAVMLVEQRSGSFKVSFRSRCDVDCSKIAYSFGGGGHKRAAGATLSDSLDEAKEKVLAAMIAAYKNDG